MDSSLLTLVVAGVGFISGILGAFIGAWFNYRFRIKEHLEKLLIEKQQEEAKRIEQLRAELSDLRLREEERLNLEPDKERLYQQMVSQLQQLRAELSEFRLREEGRLNLEPDKEMLNQLLKEHLQAVLIEISSNDEESKNKG